MKHAPRVGHNSALSAAVRACDRRSLPKSVGRVPVEVAIGVIDPYGTESASADAWRFRGRPRWSTDSDGVTVTKPQAAATTTTTSNTSVGPDGVKRPPMSIRTQAAPADQQPWNRQGVSAGAGSRKHGFDGRGASAGRARWRERKRQRREPDQRSAGQVEAKAKLRRVSVSTAQTTSNNSSESVQAGPGGVRPARGRYQLR